MNIKNTRIEVESWSVNPMIKVWVDLEFERSSEIPVSLSGKLCHQNGQIIAILTEYEINTDREYGLKLRTEDERNSREKSKSIHNIQLSAILSPLALQSIENQREKNTDKSVEFYMRFVLKTLVLPIDANDLRENDLVRLNIEVKEPRITIEQSDWINNYSSKLGIGNFLLLELNITKPNVSGFWKDLIELLTSTVLEMEKSIRLGEWKKTLEYSRQFFDGIYVKNKGGENAPFEEELRKILRTEQHNEEGINNLLKAIKSLFDFTSKYVHPKDRSGFVKPYPNAGKEDAYFVYALSIGLLNLIGSKIQRIGDKPAHNGS